ncbi:MAG: glycine-rich domain-containing protein [Rhodoferax sp.]
MRIPTAQGLAGAVALNRRIGWLAWARWLAFPGVPLAAYFLTQARWGALFGSIVLSLVLLAALLAWEHSLRRQFIRESLLPRYLGAKLCAQYPQLTARDAELVLRGLRQFFLSYSRSRHKFVGMPSKVVDAAWHEFILHTRAYAAWCDAAFGGLLHHTPAEVLGRDAKRNDGLRRTWYWCCKEEGIDPRHPSRLPLLFALDAKLGIEGGYRYVPNCKDIERQSADGSYCASSFGDSGGADGAAPGDADGFGGSDGSSGGDGGGDGGCGGGCGGD